MIKKYYIALVISIFSIAISATPTTLKRKRANSLVNKSLKKAKKEKNNYNDTEVKKIIQKYVQDITEFSSPDLDDFKNQSQIDLYYAIISENKTKANEILLSYIDIQENPIVLALKNNNSRAASLFLKYINLSSNSIYISKLINLALGIVCIKGLIEILVTLIDCGVEVNRVIDFSYKGTIYNMTPLALACINNNINIVKFLVSKNANVNAIDNLGNTPLILACYKGNIEMISILLNNGANVNVKNKNNQTPQEIINNTEYKEIIKRLLNINLNTKHLDYILLGACKNNWTETAKFLINKGANPNAKYSEQRAPLMFAARFGNIEIVKLLLDQQANINSIDNKNLTPLLYACMVGHVDVADLLLEKGAIADFLDKSIRNPLIISAYNGNLDLIRMLVNKRININTTDNCGKSPLTYACEKGHLKAAQLLLNKGANINHLDAKNYTPLFYAAYYGKTDIVKLLLEKNAWTGLINKITNINLEIKSIVKLENLIRKTAKYYNCSLNTTYISDTLSTNMANLNPQNYVWFVKRVLKQPNEVLNIVLPLLPNDAQQIVMPYQKLKNNPKAKDLLKKYIVDHNCYLKIKNNNLKKAVTEELLKIYYLNKASIPISIASNIGLDF